MVHNKQRKLWFKAVHSTIITTRRAELRTYNKKKSTDEYLLRWLNWRIAYNLYCGYQYREAFEMLEELCNTIEEVRKEEIASRTLSFLNLTVARCCLRLFIESTKHSYLTISHEYYQMSIDTLEFDLFAMFRLPMILSEFGRVLEHYGNFTGALEVYSNILTNFPNFRG